MTEAEFPEFAIKYSRTATEARRRLPVELLPTLDLIEAELADDPLRYPDRVIPASLDGSSLVYLHPDPKIQITFQVDPEKKVIYFFHYSVPVFEVTENIFISYSHKDKEWLDRLRIFLTVLEQKGLIRFWDDSQIEPGVPWEDEIKEALDSAKAALLLVSQDFLASKFITETELPKLLSNAREHGKKIFWLHLSPSTVFETHQQITRFQSLLEDPRKSLEERDGAQQKKAFVQITKKLGQAVGGL